MRQLRAYAMAALVAELRPKQEERLAGLRDMDAFAVARDAAAGIQFSVNIRANVLESLILLAEVRRF